MFRNRARIGFAAFAFGAAAVVASTLATTAPAQAFWAGFDRTHERLAFSGPGWRPSPPAYHGYWGQRRWQRYNDDDYGVRPRPQRYGYGYGWR